MTRPGEQGTYSSIMDSSSYKTGLPLLVAATLACLPGCASTSLSVRFNVNQSPLLGLSGEGTIAPLGFNGTDLALNNLTGFLFARALAADTTLSTIEIRPVLRILSRHPHEAGQIPDSLAMVVGSELNAEIALIGELERDYLEEYGEEKVFRQEEVLGRSGIRLIHRAYFRPYIDQSADITATLRAYRVDSNTLMGNYTVTESGTYRTMLPEPVEAPPEEAISVEIVSPALTESLARRIVSRLMASLVQEQIPVTRRLFVTMDNGAISAVREGDWSRAGMIWEETVANDPNDATAWNNLAVAYERSGRRIDAEGACRRALAAKPDDMTIQFNCREYGFGPGSGSDRE